MTALRRAWRYLTEEDAPVWAHDVVFAISLLVVGGLLGFALTIWKELP